jgi:hypothetical protein
MKTLPALALLALAATTNADALWRKLADDIYIAPSTLTAPTVQTRRMVLKVEGVVALFEYDCEARTAAMLYVMRPGRDPYQPTNHQPMTYRAGSTHDIVTRMVCGKGMV